MSSACSTESWVALSRVQHRRLRPRPYDLTHRTLHLLVDIDDLPRLDREVRGFALDRRARVAIHARDHLGGQDGDLRQLLAQAIAADGHVLPEGTLLLLAHPRLFGHVFNPVAWWFAHDRDGTLRMVVAEVTSTFGDRALYVLAEHETGPDGLWRSEATKRLHVSPFLPVDGLTYRFAVLPPRRGPEATGRVLVHMEVSDTDGLLLTATQDARLTPLTTSTLARAVVRHPLASLRALLAIHGHALRLWWRGTTFYRRPRPPDDALRVHGRTPTPDAGGTR